jgi:hypothetical protein
MSYHNQYHAMASFMTPPPNYDQASHDVVGYFQTTPGPPLNHSPQFNFTVQPPPGPPPQQTHTSNLAVQQPLPGTPPPREDGPNQRVFPPAFTLYSKSSLTSILDPDTLKFTLGTSPDRSLYGVKLETDLLQRPKLTLVPAWDKTLPPLATIKSKGMKDSMMTIQPPPGTNEQPLEEKLTLKYGATSRTYTFGVAIPSHGIGRRETFSWRRAGHSKKSRLEKWGLGMDMSDDLTGGARELIWDRSGEVVARWIDDDGMSSTKTGRFEFVGSGGSGVLGSRWEIMAVISVLRIWHEDYHTAKAVLEAVGGA